MPPQNRIRGNERADVRQRPTADLASKHGESTPLIVRQPHTVAAQLCLQHAILFTQEVDHDQRELTGLVRRARAQLPTNNTRNRLFGSRTMAARIVVPRPAGSSTGTPPLETTAPPASTTARIAASRSRTCSCRRVEPGS